MNIFIWSHPPGWGECGPLRNGHQPLPGVIAQGAVQAVRLDLYQQGYRLPHPKKPAPRTTLLAFWDSLACVVLGVLGVDVQGVGDSAVYSAVGALHNLVLADWAVWATPGDYQE